MKTEIKVPSMGESISEATIGTIIKASGAQVKMDDELLELETDKVNQALYAPQSGIVNWSVSAEATVKIGEVIGYIESNGKSTEPPTPPEKPSTPPPEVPAEKPKEIPPKPLEPPKEVPGKPSQNPPIKDNSPTARISKENFLAELSQEKKTSAASTSTPKQPPKEPALQVVSVKGERTETRRKMTKIRRVIAQRLLEAQQSTAMLTTFNEIDLSQVMALREKYKDLFLKTHGVKLGFMSFFVKAVVVALSEHPDLNSYIDGEEIVHREYYDIGIAVGSERGLFVPVVRSCDHLSFSQIEASIEAYAKKAREGTLAVDDLQGGGFTITNGGVYGSLLSTPILNPPQSGILGMHKIMKRAVVIDDQIVIRPMMYVALSYDHRIIDGKEAVSFLIKVKNLLEDPARFTLDV